MKRLFYIALGLLAMIGLPLAAEAIAPSAPAPDPPAVETKLPESRTITPKTRTIPPILDTAEPIEEPELISLGTFVITAYCPCEICCGKWSNPNNPLTAIGEPAAEGITVGADWDMLPPGTQILIPGVGKRTVQDKPAAWIIKRYDGRILDLYFASHEDALRFGKQELEVFIYNQKKKRHKPQTTISFIVSPIQ